MSRTFRKSLLNVRHTKAVYVEKVGPHDMFVGFSSSEELRVKRENDFEKSKRDGKYSSGKLNSLVKESARKKVRSLSRAENHRLMNNPDHETRDFVRETRGELWYWD